MLTAYGISFRYKGSKRVQQVLIFSEDDFSSALPLLKKSYEGDHWTSFDEIDKRTIKWAGDSMPIAYDIQHGAVIHLTGEGL